LKRRGASSHCDVLYCTAEVSVAGVGEYGGD
jgi:hypothetical protein